MKKRIALGLAGIMMMASLTGCGSGSEYLLDIKYSKYVELCEYKGVEATNVVYDVTDEEIQEEVEMAMYDYASYDVITDRGVEMGDYAMITYTATVDGEVSDYYSGEDEDVLVGDGFTYPELEEALVGMKTGESKKVDVELTEDYADEGDIGKIATIDVTVTEITVENMPEYNLEFVQENTDYDTIEAYEASLKEDLLASKEEEYKYLASEEILAYIVENSKFNGYPDELYEKCEAAYDSSNEYYASMYGMEVEEYLDLFEIDEETKKEEIELSVNYELVIGAIAQAEDIDCTKDEIDEYVETYYEDYGYASAEEFLDDYSAEEIGYELVYEKVMNFLYENAKFNDISEEEYLAAEEEYYDDYEESEEDVEEELEDAESEVEDELIIEDIEDAEEETEEETEE